MFIEERQSKVLDIIRQKERVEVSELCTIFNVSEDTIRRDLKSLEEKQLLERTYGGAILPEKMVLPKNYSDRLSLHAIEKKEIASKAAAFIKNGDTLFLSGATTVSSMIPHLAEFKDITIVTNSVAIAYDILQIKLKAKIYMIGGLVNNEIESTIGAESIVTMKKFSINKVYIGACNISFENGLTTDVLEEIPLYQALLEIGKEIFILADSSKFGTNSLMTISPIRPNFTIITDSKLSDDQLGKFDALLKNGLQIVKV